MSPRLGIAPSSILDVGHRTPSGLWTPSGAALAQLVLTPIASDTFNRANGAIAGANNWLATSEGSAAITSNQIAGVASTAAGDYRTDVYSSNQYAQCAVGSVALASGAYIGVSVRNQDNANNYTGIYFNNAGNYQLQVYKKVAGTFTLLLSNNIVGPLAQGTVLQLVAEGSQITFNPPAQPAVGGVSIVDTTFTGGTPGIELLGTGSLDSWVGGNAVTIAHGAASVSDNFNRANGGVSAGQANWAVMAYSPAVGATLDAPIVTNQINYTTATVHSGDVRTDAFSGDHWSSIAEGTVAMNASGFTGATTRNQNVGRSCYLFTFFNNVAYQIYRLDGTGAPGTDSSHLLGGVLTLGNDPAGTLYEGLSQGSRHSMRVNGKEILSVTDAAYAGGTPGLMMFATASADNWSGGNL